MSAFIVDPYHIRWLNTYANRWQVRTPDAGSNLTHDEAATLLWNQNVRSVAYRYRDCRPDELPGMVGFTTEVPDNTVWQHVAYDSDDFTPGHVLAALACLEYQSCETPDYRETAAYDYLEAIRHEAIRRVDGFDSAWEIKDPRFAD